jgi:DNA-binding transcriptional ArsR family regulator
MQMKTRLPLYTPSLLDQTTLEAIFVKREPILRSLLECHKESVSSDTKHFSLFIGPRGIGKTHLLSLFFHRIQADEQLCKQTLIAWLREEEWGIASYLDLLINILNSLKMDVMPADFQQQIDQLFLFEPEEAEQKAEQLLIDTIDDKTLLLITENMDITFDGLGEDGQHKLRALIQNTGKITIVAAAQSLFTAVTLRKNPFYGFFKIEHLKPLTIDEAIDLLIRIAEFDNKPDLVTMLKSTKGRVRVRALHHLASGNPRIYVTFSQLIQADSLDEFTDAVLQMLDELTPYYQAKMIQIPAAQRKLVQFLCRQQGTTPVATIAKYNHMTQQTTSSHLKKLRDSGYVTSTPVGRESHYEIAEPLMRLVLEVKDTRGTPIRLLINFLRHWFSSKELGEFVQDGQCIIFGKPWLGKGFVHQAIELNKAEDFYPQLKSCIKDYMHSLEQGNSGNLKLIKDELVEIGESTDAVAAAHPEAFYSILGPRLVRLTDNLDEIQSIDECRNRLTEANYLVLQHPHSVTAVAAFALNMLLLARFIEQITVEEGCEAIEVIKIAVLQTEELLAEGISLEALHLVFVRVLDTYLKNNQYNAAVKTYQFYFSIAEKFNLKSVWKNLLTITTSLLVNSLTANETHKILYSVDLLPQLEPMFNDIELTQALANILILRAFYAAKTKVMEDMQQTLSSIKLLAEKHSDAGIHDSYIRAISAVIPYVINEHEKEGTKLIAEAEELSNKIQSYDALLNLRFNLWNTRSHHVSINQLIDLADHENCQGMFIKGISNILRGLAYKPTEEQMQAYPLLWEKLTSCDSQEAFAPALSKAALETAKDTPQIYNQWLDNLRPFLASKPTLQQSQRILQTVKNYLDNNNDENQLLVLQKEERSLIREGLGLVD